MFVIVLLLCKLFCFISNRDSSIALDKTKSQTTRLAQLGERGPFKPNVRGSSPLSGVSFLLSFLQARNAMKSNAHTV